MYLLVDRARMGFCYRHPSTKVLWALAHIELSEAPALVFHENDLAGIALSELELKLLYKNTTEGDVSGHIAKETILKALSDAIATLEIFDGDAGEVEAQANCVSDRETDVYKYIKGTNKPRVQPDEYRPPLLKAGSAITKIKAEAAAAARQGPRNSIQGGVKQHIRNMFAACSRHTVEALTGSGQFSVGSIKTALSDLKNEKYAGGEILQTSRTKIDGVDFYIKD